MRLAMLLLLSAQAGADQPRALYFKRIAEPREGAFTLLKPSDWKAGGGLVRVNPIAAGGPLNTIAAKLDFTLTSPDGRTVLHWLPETTYSDMRKSPAAAMFPPGRNYNGAISWPLLDAFTYLDQAVFRKLHARATNVQVKGRYPLPKAAQSYLDVLHLMSAQLNYRYDVGLLLVAYTEEGAAWEEALYTAIQDMSPLGASLWSNKDTFSMRAPAGELQKTGRVVSVILNSVELNPKWAEGEIRGQMQRSQIALRTQQEVQRLDREMVEHRQRTNAEINNQMFHNLMRTDEYVNPITRKVEVGSSEWNYRWVNENGEAVYSDDPNYDPAKNGLTGFQRSQPRKRFPDQ